MTEQRPDNSQIRTDENRVSKPNNPEKAGGVETPNESNGNGSGNAKETITLPSETMQSNEIAYVYASIALDLMSYGYDVFNAVAKAEDGKVEYGLAYCDYEDCYQFENEEKLYVSSGFFSFSPNSATVMDYDSTVFLSPIDDDANEVQDEEIGYVVDFVENGIPSGHFIANNKYTQYSVKDGSIQIKTYENNSNNYDLSMGSIYNYDTEKYDFIPYDEISSDPIEYVALTDKIDAQKLKDSLYAIVDEQEKKGFCFESITIAYISIDALNALRGVLSQKDSLNGYSFEYLNSIEYDNMSQYLCFNEDGSIALKDIPPMPKTEVKGLLDWLVDGLVLAGLVAIAVVGMVFSPMTGGATAILAAACVGAGVEYFSQTVIDKKKFSEVNWAKVGIMSVAGAISAAIPCTAGTLGFVAAGAIGGITDAAMTAIDGGSLEDVLISAATGATISMITHGLFKSCFPAGTKVLTIDGLVPIESVAIGTLVASYNIYTNSIEYKPVLNTYQSYATDFVEITLENGEMITSTSKHPFYDITQMEYVPAENLNCNAILLNSIGEKIHIESVDFFQTGKMVYNLSVQDNYSYFVGEKKILVHNICSKSKIVDGKYRAFVNSGEMEKPHAHVWKGRTSIGRVFIDGKMDQSLLNDKGAVKFVKNHINEIFDLIREYYGK